MKMRNARPWRRSLMLALLTVSALVPVGCSADKERPQISSPPLADLVREAEPQLDPAAVLNDSAAALDEYDIEHASWGRRGWDQVARLRVWFCDVGVKAACD